ncbi:MFS transporter [Streptacidiphilus monticola]
MVTHHGLCYKKFPKDEEALVKARGLALAVLCAGTLMIVLDGTVVTVALPEIQRQLRFGSTGLAWVMNSYLIAFGGLLLLAGRLGDLLGRRRVLLAGLALFTVASLLCGVAADAWLLIAARALQGAGGALVSAVSLGMTAALYPDPRQRGRAFAVFGFTGSAGAALGLVLGGMLTQLAGWHWVFLINVPIGLAASLLSARILPDAPGLGLHRRADVPGALLATAGLMLAVYVTVETGTHGWLSGFTLGLGALSLALLGAFLWRQSRTADPLLPLRLLRSRSVLGANLVQLLMVAALFTFQVVLAQYLQQVRGYSAGRTGLAMVPTAVAISVATLGFAARLIRRHGEGRVLAGGLAALVAGLAWLTRAPVHGSYVLDVLPVAAAAAGFGLAVTALTGLAMDTAEADAGLASGLFNTGQQIGAALGVAATAALAAARTSRLRAVGSDPVVALNGGYHAAFGMGAVLLAVALAVAVALFVRPRQDRPAGAGSAAGPARQQPGLRQEVCSSR